MEQQSCSHIQMASRPDWQDRRAFAATLPNTPVVAVAAPAESSYSLAHTHESASGSTTQRASSHRPRVFAGLNGLRGLAILLVVWCHTDYYVSSYVHTWPLEHVLGGAASSGVDLFFVLSGFLLFLPIARAIMTGDRWPSISRFYLRRALRILPSYYFLILIVLVFLSSYPNGAVSRLLGPLQALLGLTLLYDLQSDAYNLAFAFDGPLWSLTLEWQFYLLLPWLAYALARLVSLFRRHIPKLDRWPWGLFVGLGSLVAIGLVVRTLAAFAHYAWGDLNAYAWGYPTASQIHLWIDMLISALYGAKGKYIEVFALGMLASTIYMAGVEQGRLPHRLRAPLGWSLCGISLLGIAACILWALQAHRLYGWEGWSNNFPPASAWLWSILGEEAFGFCYMCLLLGTLLVPAVTQVFSWGPLRFFGKISYSLYLWHMIGLALFFGFTRGSFTVVSVALILFFIVLWSTTLYALIERPFLRLQSRFRSG